MLGVVDLGRGRLIRISDVSHCVSWKLLSYIRPVHWAGAEVVHETRSTRLNIYGTQE